MACIMASTEGYSEGPNCDAQSTVCLLDADATDELHNVPLDADQPLALQGSAPEYVTQNRTKRKLLHQCSTWEHCLLILARTLTIFITLTYFTLLFYILCLYRHNHKLLQMLTQKLDAQSQILRQMAANQHQPGYNPGGL